MMTSVRRYRQIVDQFESTARAHVRTGMPMADLCRIADVNQRTLLRAFRAIRGTTPSCYVHALRLDQVRQALLSADGAQTVTQVAMRFGFRELGRFAGDYKAAFGERPSETLRGIPVRRHSD